MNLQNLGSMSLVSHGSIDLIGVMMQITITDDSGVRRNPETDADYDANFDIYRTRETADLIDMIKKYGHSMHIENLKAYLRWIEPEYIAVEDWILMTSMRRLIDNGRFEDEKTK